MEKEVKAFQARPEHKALRDEFCAVIGRHENELSPMEMLAVAAQLVGQLIACQDQRRLTRAEAMAIVSANIQTGNLAMADHLIGTPKGRA